MKFGEITVFYAVVIFMYAVLHSLRSKEFIRPSLVFVSVHKTELYKNTLAAQQLKVCVLIEAFNVRL